MIVHPFQSIHSEFVYNETTQIVFYTRKLLSLHTKAIKA